MKGYELRPVGTVFEVEYRPKPDSCNEPFRVIRTMRVVAHVETARNMQGDPGPIMEELECVRIRKFPQMLVYGPVTEIKLHYEDDPRGEWIEEVIKP